MVLDDFFKSWEAGGILAYLRDTAHQADGRDLLKEAGGLYLSRQEVQNIMNGALKKAYPGQDISEVKKQMDKYKTYTTCNFKGCNAPAFPDIKALMDHRKAVHGLKNHDHSDKLYACPDKTCWRRKKSKGFATLLGLEEHMREKHGPGSNAEQTMDPQLQSPAMQGPLQQMLTDPITPASSTPESVAQHHGQDGQMRAEETRTLSESEQESMKLRLKRLEIERTKLDHEIQRLNRILYGESSEDISSNHEDG